MPWHADRVRFKAQALRVVTGMSDYQTGTGEAGVVGRAGEMGA